MSTNTFSGISERSSTRLHAAPGGNQSFNIFSGEDNSAQKKGAKPSNPTYAYNPASPFNKGPAPVESFGRRPSKANLSGNIDFAAPPEAPPQRPTAGMVNKQSTSQEFAVKKAPPRANMVTAANPFSNQEYAPPPPAVKSPPKANEMSQANPLNYNAAAQAAPLTKQRSSTRLHAPPGGNQSFNVFNSQQGQDDEEDEEEARRRARRGSQSAAYGYAADSPFNPNAPQPKPKPGGKANEVTPANPFSQQQFEQQQQYGIRPAPINAPSKQSPFNPAQDQGPMRRPSKTTHQSNDSPFVQTGITSERKSASSVRLHAPPGGKSNITFG